MADDMSEKFTSEQQEEQAEAFAGDEPFMKTLLDQVAATGESGLMDKLADSAVTFEKGYVSVAGKPFAVEVHADGGCALLYQEGPVHPSQERDDYLAERDAQGEVTYWPTACEGTTPWTDLSGEFRAFQEAVMTALA